MPELPEVETVRTGLAMTLTGARIRDVTLGRKDLRVPFPRNLAAALVGRRIEAIKRRAKYLLFYLDNDDVVIAHLGMSGNFSVHQNKPYGFGAHDHVVIRFDDDRYLIFNDPRRFGLMLLEKSSQIESHRLFSALGPEPLEKTFSAAYLSKQLENRKMPVKPALMDQALVVGVGNIYASEALFLAGIDPRKPAARVHKKAAPIIAAIRKVLNDAIASGGSSLRDFLQVSGETGYFQHHFNVYGRAGKPCFKCKTKIISIRQSGRATFFCPQCQK